MIWLIRNILLALSSETNPNQIAFGALFGLLLGLCPVDNLIWPTIVSFVFIFRINIGMTIVFFSFGSMVALAVSGLRNEFGVNILNYEMLKNFFTSLYNTPVIGISGFNNPEVMGAIGLTILSSIIIIPAMIKITKIFRTKIQPWLEKIWIIRVLKGSKLYQFYVRIIG
jgi:uncharacterized protein (TIGR03546 family)